MKYMGKLTKVLLIKVRLAYLEKYIRFQLASGPSIFSLTSPKIVFSVKVAPKGRPRYFIGKEATLIRKYLSSSQNCRLDSQNSPF